MSIITRFLYKIKSYIGDHLEEVGVSLIIVFVGISSFYLGKYSVLDTEPQGRITIENHGLENPSVTNTPSNKVTSHEGVPASTGSTQVVASKTGKKYYLPWCGAAQKISDKNKVYFASALDAERAGLTKASNCKGM